MAKPIHEQEWRLRMTNIGPVVDDVSTEPEGESVCMVYAPMPDMSRQMTLEESDALRGARAKAIVALPDMARALLALGVVRGGEWHSRDACGDICNEVTSALRKAGVLP